MLDKTKLSRELLSRALSSLQGGSLEITLKVPLNGEKSKNGLNIKLGWIKKIIRIKNGFRLNKAHQFDQYFEFE